MKIRLLQSADQQRMRAEKYQQKMFWGPRRSFKQFLARSDIYFYFYFFPLHHT